MNKPLARRPAPPASASQIVYEMRQERQRATEATWSAACWLSILAVIAPLVPVVGVAVSAAGAEIFAIIMLVIAIVLFVRGAVMRGIVTILLTFALCLWLKGGAIAVLLFLNRNYDFKLPWPVFPQ